MKKKILLLTTGGTIACTEGTDGFTPTLPGEELLSHVPGISRYADIRVQGILNKDSSNMNPQDWVTIADAVFENRNGYDGIVILHGTDTMAYSAAAVSFMTLGAELPIVFTGSQRPIGQPDSDGPKNIRDAVLTACSDGIRGVFIVFDGQILNGCCASKVNTSELHAFESVSGHSVGRVQDDRVTFLNIPRRNYEKELLWKRCYENSVLFLKVIPGMDAGLLEIAKTKFYRAVILEAFGLGGIPDEESGLLAQIEKLRREGVLVMVTTQCSYGKCDMEVYEVGRAALKKGALCSRVVAKEALLAKMMWGLGITKDTHELARLLFDDYCGELGSSGRDS